MPLHVQISWPWSSYIILYEAAIFHILSFNDRNICKDCWSLPARSAINGIMNNAFPCIWGLHRTPVPFVTFRFISWLECLQIWHVHARAFRPESHIVLQWDNERTWTVTSLIGVEGDLQDCIAQSYLDIVLVISTGDSRTIFAWHLQQSPADD